MVIKNKILKNYVFTNTTSTIRSRGNSLTVKTIEFNEDYSSVIAKVKGTKLYTITFDGLQSDMLMSSCTCPYDYEGLCKHEVAVANEIDRYLGLEKKNEKGKKITKYSITGAYELPFKDIKDVSNTVLMNNASKASYREGTNWGINIEEVILVEENKVKGIVTEDYYNDLPKEVDLAIQKDKLSLTCNCKATNQTLCKHQVAILMTLRDEFTSLFFSEEKKNKLKEEKLAEYGFSIKDKNIDEFFSFGFSNEGMQVIPKKEGIVRLSSFNDLGFITEDFLEESNIVKSILPRKIDNKVKKGIALGVVLIPEYDVSINLFILEGKLNAKEELSSQIRVLDAQSYIENKNKYSEKEQFVLEEVLSVSEDLIESKLRTEENFNADKAIIQVLKKIIPLLKDFKVYELENNFFNIKKKDLIPVELNLASPELSFKLIEEESFYVLESYIRFNNRNQKLGKRAIGDSTVLLKDKETYFLVKSITDVKTLGFFREHSELRFPKSDYDNYYNKLIKPLSEKYQVEIKGVKKKKKKATDALFKKQLFLSSVNDFIIFKPAIGYQDQIIQLSSKREFEFEEGNSNYIIPRNIELEASFKECIKSLHPDFSNQDDDFFFLSEEDFIKDTWFINFFDALKKEEISVFGYKDLKLKYNQNRPSININISSEIDWFDVNILVAFGEQIVGLKDLKKNIINKDKYVQLKDGSIGILPEEWLGKYLHLFRSGNVKKDSIAISKYQFSVIDTLYEELENENNLFDEHLKIKEKIANFNTIENIRQPRGLNAKLRPYQKEGIKWLNFLDDFKLGGCLADDMGLGKTLQVISFIKHLKAKNKNKKPHLIILPTSLIFNWNAEVEKFCPSLKVFNLIGTNREKNTDNFKEYDIILTTYGIVMNDIGYLKKYDFNYIILDESQAIKNPTSKRFKAVRLLKGENRLVLTGTPIENNTFDLYAQMTFVNPGLLGGMNHFKKEYATAIDKNKDQEVAKELKALIDPFLLRRTKEQVAKELPPKTEQFLYCTMGTEQRKLYEAYKNKYKDYLLGKIESDGVGKSKMYVLEGLTKLRQICDSPSLLNDDEEYTNESIKIDELVKHITEKTSNHKILIFSQFTKMLGLIKNRLHDLAIEYEYLDGKTRNRQEKVDNFQNNESTRVFLISLKAGGTGLNLTAADYVYIVDPWWNPAVEAQAIDRCYRIGQKKKVMAYKMICKDTIEEKIVTHQQNKKQVSDELIQIEDSFVKSLNKESIESLFS